MKLFKVRINWIFIILLSIILIPFIVLFFFNHPSADDFCFGTIFRRDGLIGGQVTYYLTWSGRYFATFVMAFNPVNWGSFTGYKIFESLLFVALFLSIFVLIRLSFKKYISFELQLLGTLGIFIGYILTMPSLLEGIYWASGAFTYQLGNIFTVVYLAILLNFEKVNSKISRIAFFVLEILSIIFAVGSNETTMLIILLSNILGFIYSLYTKSKYKKLYFTFLIVSIICVSIVYFAPGNASRYASIDMTHGRNALFSIKESFKFAFNFAMSSFSINLLPFGVVLGYLSSQLPLVKMKKSLLYLGTLVIVGFIFMWATCFPTFWLVGSGPIARTLNITYLIFVLILVGLIWFLINSCRLLIEKYVNKIKLPFTIPSIILPIVSILLFIILLIFTVPSANNFITPIDDLTSGNAYRYNNELNSRYRYIKANKSSNANLIVDKIENVSKSVTFSDITTNPKDWTNSCYADYFGVESIAVK